jgi:hypothetical protein
MTAETKVHHRTFVPTAEQRKIVEELVGFGIPLIEICRIIVNPQTDNGISINTLYSAFSEEIATGQPRANMAVARFLFNKASGKLGSDTAAVTAAIFWMKCRARWKPFREEVTEDNVAVAQRYVGKKEQARIESEKPPERGSSWERLLN